MSISSLLDIAWDHAFWTEGPQFTALGLSNGASVSSWPDEIDVSTPAAGGWRTGFINMKPPVAGHTGVFLTQATGSKQPSYVSSDASFNNKPVVSFDGTDDYLHGLWASTLARPNHIVCVGRYRSMAGSSIIGMWGGSEPASSSRHWGRVNSGRTQYEYYSGNSGVTSGLPTPDTNAHMFIQKQASFDGTGYDANRVDGTTATDTTNHGVDDSKGAMLGAINNNSASSFGPVDVAFWAIKDTILTSTEVSDILAYCQSHYSTP